MLSLSILTAGYSRPGSPEKRGEEQGKGEGRGGEHFQYISAFLDLRRCIHHPNQAHPP